MGLNNLFLAITSMMNSTSSIFSTANVSNYLCSAISQNGINSLITSIGKFITRLIYIIAKWIMMVVDIIFSYVQELAGLNMDFSSMDTLMSENSDMVFRLLYSSKNTIVPILRALIVLAIVMIIIFSIAALIKNQYISFKNGGPSEVGSVFRNLLKSLLLLVLTPMISLVGIVASDLLLQTLYNATNVNGSVSLGTQIFSSSSTVANAYRIYAQNNKRIPIVFDAGDNDEVLNYYETHSLTGEFAEYMKSSKNNIYSTFLMFNKGDYFDYSTMNVILNDSTATKNQNDAYYLLYDTNKTIEEGEDQRFAEYKKIENYAEEYYAMADVIDYAMASSNAVYFKTVEEVLDSIVKLENSDATFDAYLNNLMWNIVNVYQIKFLKDNDSELSIDESNYSSLMTKYKTDEWNAIRYSSDYLAMDSNSNPTSKMQVQYTHLRGAKDEFNGAKYIVAVERTFEFAGKSYAYLYPLTNGYKQNSKSIFTTEHMQKGQIIAAKGIFDNSMYPTAIRTNQTGAVEFYRDKIDKVALGQSSEMFSLKIIKEETSNPFKRIINFFKSLFNPASLVPKFDVNVDAVSNAYTKNQETINRLSDGRLHIGYMMSTSDFDLSKLATGDVYSSINITNIYDTAKLNFFLLLFGTIILVKVSFAAIFSLIERSYDLFIIIIFYPTACATLPISNTSYKNWLNKYMSRLFTTYGLILALNFVFILFPVIETIEFFTPQDIGNSLVIRRVGWLFFGFLNVNEITAMLNLVVVLLFEMVAITLIKSAPDLVQAIVGKGGDKDSKSSTLEEIKNTKNAVMSIPTKIFTGATLVFGGIKGGVLKIAHPVKTAQEFAKKNGPMSAIIEAGADKAYLHKKKQEQKDAERELKETLHSSDATPKQAKEALDKYMKSIDAYTKAIKKPTEMREAENAKVKEEKKKEREQSINSRNEEDLEQNDNSDFSNKSEKEIKKIQKQTLKKQKQAKKELKKLRNSIKHSKGGIDYDRYEKLENEIITKQQSVLDKCKAELETIKTEKSNGTISQRDARVEKAHEEKKKNDKINKANKKVEDRKKKFDQKISKRQKEERERDNRAITGRGPINDIRRKRIISQTAKNEEKVKNILTKNGITLDKDKSTDEQLKDLAMNGDLSLSEKRELTKYLASNSGGTTRMQNLAELSTKWNNDSEIIKQKQREKKNDKYIRKHSSRKINKHGSKQGLNQNVDQLSSEIEKLEKYIKAIQDSGIDVSNIDEYQKLNLQRSKLKAAIEERKQWQANTADIKATKQNLKQERKFDKMNDKLEERATYLIKTSGVEIPIKNKDGTVEMVNIKDPFDPAAREKALEIVRKADEIRKK